IVSDGTSMGILAKEFMQLYDSGEKSLLPLSIQYKDYACWQKREMESGQLKRQGDYWLRELDGEIPVLELPFDHDRALTWDFEGGHVWFELGKEQTDGLKALAREEDATLYMVLASVYMVLLSKLSGQDEIIIGAPMAGRRHSDVQNVFGMFVNTLVLRSFVDKNMSYRDYLEELKPRILAAFENQDYPFEEMVKQKAAHREAGRNPLFDVTFVLQNMEIPEINIPGLDLKPYPFESKSAKLDLALIAEERGENLQFAFEYMEKLFNHETVERFSRYFMQAVWEVLESPERRICDIEIIPVEEKRRLLEDFNDTDVDYPGNKTLHQLFMEQVERTPDRIALVGADLRVCPVSLSYNELNEQSDRMAGLLIERGILADNVVGIMVERSVEMIIGILGILKSGGAYLPIDPGYPQERIDYMLKDSGAKILINEKFFAPLFFKKAGRRGFHHSSFIVHRSNLAYIIYTSGSTGRPKGVMIRERGFLNLLRWYIEELNIGEEENCLLIAPISFDLSQKNLFSPFLTGGCLTLASPGIPDYRELAELIHKEHITIINCAPSVFYPLVEQDTDNGFTQLQSLQAVVLGGEPIRSDRLLPWVDSEAFHCDIINTYGPTECTDIATFFRIPRESFHLQKTIPIGKPIPNAKVYVLDKSLKVLPMRVPGELCIGGIGLSIGYQNNIPLTQEKFVDTPHLPEKKVYRTGDLTRWLPDGNIEFLGREDYQVKVRGFRIELGEIESELAKNVKIKEVVVIARKNENGDHYLCAYIVPRPEQSLSVFDLRENLGRQLPDYMVPAYFISLDRIPLTPSGKIDRRGLPEPEIKKEKDYTAPRNRIEEELVEIWRRVLDIKALSTAAIGIDDNFFQLGGDSLKTTLLVSRIHKVFNVKIPLAEIFKRPTIRGLFDFIKGAVGEQYIRIEPVEEKEYYELSSAQKRLYFLQQMDTAGTAYNISAALVLEGVLNRDKLEDTFVRLVERHESLRTSFVIIDEEPVQRIYEQAEFKIEELWIRDQELEVSRGDSLWSPFIRPFDLSQAPLLRAGLAQLAENTYLLAVDMHHIISDGMSTQVLVNDFSALYAGKKLTEIKLQYKNYAEWQNREKRGENILKQGAYWKKEFAGEIPVLDLPTDYRRPAVQSFEGSSINFEINNETSGIINALVMETGATLYMVLLALYTILLSKLSSREDIIIGSPVAGRRHADLEKIIGMFVNTLALRNYPSAEKKFRDFLSEVMETALKGFENQDYQYEDLLEQISVNRDAGRNPLFDTVFVLQNIGSQQIEIPGLKLGPYEYENKTSKFDLTLTTVEAEEKLLFTFEYCTKLFKRETIERFIVYFKKIVEQLPLYIDKNLSEIEIITQDERDRILYEFNDTAAEYPCDKTIHQLFEEQVFRVPDHVALVGAESNSAPSFRHINMSYRQLNEQSNRLVGFLIETGVLADNIVGIMAERSLETIVGIIGILKSGGAYLPIDPGYPQERIDYMLKDSGAKILINEKFFAPLFFKKAGRRGLHQSIQLAYIIYTSGTTGKPKGVLIEHKNVVRLLFNGRFQFDFNSQDVWSLFHSYSFDFSVWEMYGALLYGGRLVVIPQMTARDPRQFLDVLLDQKVTVLNQTPSAFYNLIDEDLKSPKKDLRLRYVIFGGEALKPGRLKTWWKKYPETKLINMFGITETCVHVTYKEIGEIEIEGDISNIGKPIPTLSAYIMDRNQRLAPTETPGELYVGGEGVARGYLNRPELTSERFVKNLYKTGERLYRSGDLARLCSDGEMVYLGRVDHQVQLRGFRIELGEIENRLLKYEGIKEVVVIERSIASGDLFLCAYIVPQP
ncbi:MAG: hypothetical protein QG657_4442, partial [Acidobacteriota bacterium]|nr:hypothetical protein [Acidobacteriota bacterium]